jgi:hypothetical protein
VVGIRVCIVGVVAGAAAIITIIVVFVRVGKESNIIDVLE